MKNKLILVLSLLLISAMVLSGCASPSGDLMKGIISTNKDRVPESMDTELNHAVLDFTWNLFKESSENQGNIMISAPSAYFALAMTLNGADNETKTEMLKALSADNITLEDLNNGLNDFMTLMSKDRIAKFSITNSIWLREGYNANKDFLQANADYYSAYIKSLDFSDASAPDTINKWVKEATNEKIDKIVDEISDDLVMYLINAIYFKGDWKEEFSPNKTREMKFNAPTGKVKTDFMNRRGNIDYLKLNDITGVVLPYLDEQFAFVGLLPAEGQTPKDLINDLSALDLARLLKDKEVKNIELSLPKFESSYEDSLKNELSNLGMNIAFEPYSADFSLMSENFKKDLYISEVKQKTYIKVDEKGTEAAAVTVVGAEATSMPVELPKIVFDRPFVYGIVDVETGIPLFIGIMENPSIK
ncbi:MAG: serpin family protein [Tissierellia bacterium]|jgi:serpin B|nr:serpin family protein [Tissierellia bacterium]MDD3752083.1 serpin family protein [Tissierellia bacterium]MDD4047181.1 serpin family protein [Tissierellia bacterium]MDD4679128.1 serpin family protein [Tissierellia bacterium]